jgi:nucleoside-diphosphate-sugar epimerase
MKIIVTGGGGFIAGHTILELRKLGYEVLPLDIRASSLFPEIEITICDILSSDLKKYINEGDKILHLCAVPIVEADPRIIFRVNVEGLINVVQCALEKKAERIVAASSGAVYFGISDIHPPIDESCSMQPNTYYGFSKVVAEQILKMHKNDLPFINLRYGYVYGRGAKGAVSCFINLLSQNKPVILYGGKQQVEQVYVKDIVQANILALNTSYTNESYNIGTGNPMPIRQIYDICSILLNRKLEPIIKPARPWDPPIFWYDIGKAIRLLGYSPKWTLTEGIKDMLREIEIRGS